MPESTFWAELKGQTGAAELDAILGQRVFAFPKSRELIQRLIDVAAPDDAIVLDSFAGSGTTAHGVLQLNQSEGAKRKFILVEK